MKAYLSFFLFCFVIHAVPFAQPKFSIALMVEDTSAYTAYHNEPLIFTTILVNKELQQNLQWNRAADAWLVEVAADYKAGKLSKEEFEKETALVINGKKQIGATTVGTNRLPWFHQLQFRVLFKNDNKQISWPISLLGDPLTDSIAILDDDGYYRVMHHLGPEQLAKQKPGTYTIQVLLAGIWSNTVSVNLRHEDIPNHVLKTAKMQLRLGNYYLDRKDADKALDYAEDILKKDDDNIKGLILCGEGYILKNNYKKALTCFKEALKQYKKQFPDLQESPIYLLGTIAWLEQRQTSKSEADDDERRK
jgi:tetratricopeptide (TPR) repeat protein